MKPPAGLDHVSASSPLDPQLGFRVWPITRLLSPAPITAWAAKVRIPTKCRATGRSPRPTRRLASSKVARWLLRGSAGLRPRFPKIFRISVARFSSMRCSSSPTAMIERIHRRPIRSKPTGNPRGSSYPCAKTFARRRARPRLTSSRLHETTRIPKLLSAQGCQHLNVVAPVLSEAQLGTAQRLVGANGHHYIRLAGRGRLMPVGDDHCSDYSILGGGMSADRRTVASTPSFVWPTQPKSEID